MVWFMYSFSRRLVRSTTSGALKSTEAPPPPPLPPPELFGDYLECFTRNGIQTRTYLKAKETMAKNDDGHRNSTNSQNAKDSQKRHLCAKSHHRHREHAYLAIHIRAEGRKEWLAVHERKETTTTAKKRLVGQYAITWLRALSVRLTNTR
jgi:uncharacterized protein YxeA